jgi:hypothetical protein
VPGDTRSGTSVALELKVLVLVMLGDVDANDGSPVTDASGLSAPADAIIWGLSRLVGLAKLPFLECCMPCTMLVCR